ncbi:MAG: hypothetical protein M1834_004932 [Cirrosporium novae-zelandiae]|nr:MAG: hypothetical protein M1834_004932 [Cirrosporium novae-zelandiae]
MRDFLPTLAVAAALIPSSFGLSGYTNVSEVPLYGLSPPVYPSRELTIPLSFKLHNSRRTAQGNGSTSAKWGAAYTKAHTFVNQLTLEEKVNLTRGYSGNCLGNTGSVPRLGFNPICFMDTPCGIRVTDFVSAFPAGIHLAATFDKEAMYAWGYALGEEEVGKGVNVALGPVAGPLGRVVRSGRLWEGFSADPYLNGVAMGKTIGGMQEAGVIATPKHWLLNEQEYRRLPGDLGESISSNVDDRTLHELYSWPFMDALRAGAGAVLCSYQRANNSYACQNSKLLNGILKTELGFEGFVVSDWGGQQSGVASANAGLDVAMPGAEFWGTNLTNAINNGSVAESRLNDMVTRLLASYYYLGQENDFPDVGIYSPSVQHPIVDVRADHSKIIREVGAEGHVLVKNVNNTLPLKKPKFLSIFGYDAEVKANPWTNSARYGGGYEVNFNWTTFNGTLITAGGSGGNAPPFVVSPFKAIQDRIRADHGILRWDFYSENPTIEPTTQACLVFINAYSSEGFDRWSLYNTFSDNLVKNVAKNCSNTIVIMHTVGIRVVDSWIDHENITAVIFAGLPGEESGNSLVDILYGDISPSGRLPYTVAHNESDYGSVLNSTADAGPFPQQNFTEGVYIDYRAFDHKDISPRFEFGFGLSYSTFTYSSLTTTASTNASTAIWPPAAAIIQGGHPRLWDTLYTITCTITNTGSVAAAEIPQLYLSIPDSPKRQLRGFDRVNLSVNETKTVTFELTRRDFSVWDVDAQQWKLQRGSYPLWVGASSRDLKLNDTIWFA